MIYRNCLLGVSQRSNKIDVINCEYNVEKTQNEGRCILNFLWKRVFGQEFKLKRGVENPNNHVSQLLF